MLCTQGNSSALWNLLFTSAAPAGVSTVKLPDGGCAGAVQRVAFGPGFHRHACRAQPQCSRHDRLGYWATGQLLGRRNHPKQWSAGWLLFWMSSAVCLAKGTTPSTSKKQADRWDTLHMGSSREKGATRDTNPLQPPSPLPPDLRGLSAPPGPWGLPMAPLCPPSLSAAEGDGRLRASCPPLLASLPQGPKRLPGARPRAA